MSVHIDADKGQIAETVLLPCNPLRARHIAESMLENSVCYNEIRAMYGFTGKYKVKRVSVQGTGIPSTSIYVNELITEYNDNKVAGKQNTAKERKYSFTDMLKKQRLN